jgi:hypothetical protein
MLLFRCGGLGLKNEAAARRGFYVSIIWIQNKDRAAARRAIELNWLGRWPGMTPDFMPL